MRKVKYKPTIYRPTNSPSPIKTLEGVSVAPVMFDSMSACRKFIHTHEDIQGFDYYGNIHYPTAFIGEQFPGDIKPDMDKINILSFDIENARAPDGNYSPPLQAEGEVTLITAKSNRSPLVHVWGVKVYDPSKAVIDNVDPSNIRYHHCDDEIDLLSRFLTYLNAPSTMPDAVTGYNIKLYDIPYLYTRITKLMGEDRAKLLSPWKVVMERTTTNKITQKDETYYELVGLPQIDFMEAFIKFGLKYNKLENNKLKTVANEILGRSKVDFSEHKDLDELYEKDYQKFVDYGITDTVLIEDMEEASGLIALAMLIAYKAGANYTDAFGTIRVWTSMIERFLWKKGIVPPAMSFENEKVKYAGGYVKEPVPGLYEWVCSFDLASMYPNLTIQYNISPDTIQPTMITGMSVESCLDGTAPSVPMEYSVAVNGSMYSKDHQGFIPELLQAMFDERKMYKGLMLDAEKEVEHLKTLGQDPNASKKMAVLNNNIQMALKILLNSVYGAMGNVFFRWYDLRMAEGITLSGQYAIKTAERAVNRYLNKLLGTDESYIIAIDTDSVYVHMEAIIEKVNPDDPIEFLNTFCKHIEKRIKAAYVDMFNKMNAYKPRMDMDREVIANRGIWTAKKRYVLNVYDNEGVRYKEPKLKIMGLEVVKSSTPQVCRDKLRDTIQLIMTTTEPELQKFVADFRLEYQKLPPEDIAQPRRVSNVAKWALGDKGLPMHVRAALVYNDRLVRLKQDKKYVTITNGDHMKYIFLQLPNPTYNNVIGMSDELPKEFDLNDYIDYDMNFEKTYLAPLQPLLDAAGWHATKTFSLDDFAN